MILVDTSCWVHFLRKDGNPQTKEKVLQILGEGSAVTCPVVLAELWMGAGSQKDQEDVSKLQGVLPCLLISGQVWEKSYDLAKACRKNGTPVPASDLIIAACAFYHGAHVEAVDKHFSVLKSYHECTG
jgi:predicted nucleic acid-binding protein